MALFRVTLTITDDSLRGLNPNPGAKTRYGRSGPVVELETGCMTLEPIEVSAMDSVRAISGALNTVRHELGDSPLVRRPDIFTAEVELLDDNGFGY
jgi:hypothetical protein